ARAGEVLLVGPARPGVGLRHAVRVGPVLPHPGLLSRGGLTPLARAGPRAVGGRRPDRAAAGVPPAARPALPGVPALPPLTVTAGRSFATSGEPQGRCRWWADPRGRGVARQIGRRMWRCGRGGVVGAAHPSAGGDGLPTSTP